MISMTEPTIQIIVSPDFQAQTRKLGKRYRSIRTDLQPLLDDIQSGNFMGDHLTNTGAIVFKVRLKNSDIQKGKSGGYRVIYQLRDNTCVLLLVIYSKSDQEDVSADQIRAIIAAFDEPAALD
jgi:mRNA-degrading endonuclease RelE of RelBE toxin-antitoxin system